MPTYASVAEIKDEMAAGSESQATEDAQLLKQARKASARLDKLLFAKKSPFFPLIEARQVQLEQSRISSSENTFWFEQPLLSLSTLDAGGTALVTGTNVELWPSLQSPADTLRLLSFDTSWYRYLPCSGAPGFVTLTGIWGVHSDYPNAWLDVDTLAESVDDAVREITVTDAAGMDPMGNEPKLSPGHLLKIEDEWLDVIRVDEETNILTVLRGVRGSTAVDHSADAVVSVWQVEEPVRRLVARQTAFMYARRGAYESSTINDFGVVNFPSDQLKEVRGILQGYAYGSY
jgi:hypothetical protein